MNATTRLVRISSEAHREYSRMAATLGVSMSAVAALAIESLRRHGVKVHQPDVTMYDRRNSRTARRAVEAK